MRQVNDQDDAMLSAYLDGELPQEEAGRVRARLAAEPAFARRLEELEQANAAARKALAAGDDEPLPQAVLDLLGTAEAGRDTRPASGSKLLRFPVRGVRRWATAPVAIAASVALVAGFLMHGLLRQAPSAADPAQLLYAGGVPHDSGLHRLLEEAASGEPAELAGGVDGRVLLTFENVAGDWCRQVELAGQARSMQALACRRGGSWEMEAVGFGPAAPDGQYRTASPDSAAVHAAVEAQIGAGTPVTAEEENLAISSGWDISGE